MTWVEDKDAVVVVVADRVAVVVADRVAVVWEAPRPRGRVAAASAQAADTGSLISLANHATKYHAPGVALRWQGSKT
jgi:hypothetical protein